MTRFLKISATLVGIVVACGGVVLAGRAFLRAEDERFARDQKRNEPYEKARARAFSAGIDNCINKKGVPVFSAWDGRLIDCR
jgi:hypothetical protein